MLSINSWARSGVLVCLLMSISGCGGPDLPYEVVPLEGTVTYQGEPLEGVTVHFRPTEGRESTAISEEGGKFVMRYTHGVDGVQKGTGKFFLTMPEQMGGLASSQGSSSAALAEAVKKYSSENTTLETEITEPNKNYELALE